MNFTSRRVVFFQRQNKYKTEAGKIQKIIIIIMKNRWGKSRWWPVELTWCRFEKRNPYFGTMQKLPENSKNKQGTTNMEQRWKKKKKGTVAKNYRRTVIKSLIRANAAHLNPISAYIATKTHTQWTQRTILQAVVSCRGRKSHSEQKLAVLRQLGEAHLTLRRLIAELPHGQTGKLAFGVPAHSISDQGTRKLDFLTR